MNTLALFVWTPGDVIGVLAVVTLLIAGFLLAMGWLIGVAFRLLGRTWDAFYEWMLKL